MKRSLWCALILAAFAQVAAAQDPVAVALTDAASGAFSDPSKACADLLKGGDFRVSSGKSYYKTAVSQSDSGNRNRILRNALSNFNDALAGGQGKLATTWYWLARTDMALGDVTGADSAYRKTLELAPGCKTEIDNSRQLVWYRLLGKANDREKAGDNLGALAFFRGANRVYTESPTAYINMASLFSGMKQEDSAKYYFEMAAKAPYTASDTNAVSMHNQSLYNSGVMQISAKEWPKAIASFHAYVASNPTDADGKKGLAQAFIGAGMQDSAQAILSSIGMGGGAAAPASPADSAFNAGVVQYNAKDYKGAEASFGTVVQLRPYLRDALYNQANAQLALQNGPALLASSRKLMASEPYNDRYVSLEVAALRFTKGTADLNKLATDRAGWPITLDIPEFTPGADSVTLTGTATGQEPRDAAGKAIKPAPVTLVFEFLDQGGAVVTTTEVTVPALPPTQTSPIKVTGAGKGIATWRYHKK